MIENNDVIEVSFTKDKTMLLVNSAEGFKEVPVQRIKGYVYLDEKLEKKAVSINTGCGGYSDGVGFNDILPTKDEAYDRRKILPLTEQYYVSKDCQSSYEDNFWNQAKEVVTIPVGLVINTPLVVGAVVVDILSLPFRGVMNNSENKAVDRDIKTIMEASVEEDTEIVVSHKRFKRIQDILSTLKSR